MLRLFRQHYPIRNIFFVLGEGVLIYLSLLLSSMLLLEQRSAVFEMKFQLRFFMITLITQACLYFNDLYELLAIDTYRELSLRLLQALGVTAILLGGVFFFVPAMVIPDTIIGVSAILLLVLIFSWRFFYAIMLNVGMFNQRIIVLGSGLLARDIINEISAKKDCGYTVCAAVIENSSNPCMRDSQHQEMVCKGEFEGLCELAKEMEVTRIVVALIEKRGKLPIWELLRCKTEGIEIIEGNSFYEMLTGKLLVEHINPAWLIYSQGFDRSKAQRFFKRSADLLLAVCLVILFLPIILITAIVIKLDSAGPVLFSQERVGERRRPYRIVKFRSMIADAEKRSGPVWAKDNDDRITRVGHFIRKWRLDELPQLWNVLKGEMSFVGPRPEREYFVSQLEETIPYYRERLTVKPGLTGWAQVCYGYGASVDDAREKLNYDLFYIKNMSLFMDLMIVFRTIKTVIFGKGR